MSIRLLAQANEAFPTKGFGNGQHGQSRRAIRDNWCDVENTTGQPQSAAHSSNSLLASSITTAITLQMAPLPLSAPRGKGVFNRILSSLSSFFKSKPKPAPVELEMQVLSPPVKYRTWAPEPPRPTEKGKGKAPMPSDPEPPRSKEKSKGKAPMLSDPEFPRSKEKGKGKAAMLSDPEFPRSGEKGKGKAPMLSNLEFPRSKEKGKGKAPIPYAPESSRSNEKGKGKASVLSGLKFPKPEKSEDAPKATVMFPKPEDAEMRKDTVMFPPKSPPATTKSTWNNGGFSFYDYQDELMLNPWNDYRKRSFQVQQNAATMNEMGASMPELGKCRLTMSQEISLLIFAWIAAMFICGAIVWVVGKVERKIHRLMERSATGSGEKKGWLRALHFVEYGSMVIVIIAMFLMLIAVMFSLKNILGEAISGA
ncbi:hypothetical protein HOY82DRAFT_605512 [Tuber indicum]|nr:hypothetical protein HOY82DRAFT_605512 [Tuber indicum]